MSVAALPTHTGYRIIEPLPDGAFLAGTLKGTLVRIEAGEVAREATLQEVWSKNPIADRVHAISMHPDGRHAAICVGRNIVMIDAVTLETIWRVQGRALFGLLSITPRACMWMETGELLISLDSGMLEVRSSSGDLLRKRRESDAPNVAHGLVDGVGFVGCIANQVIIWDSRSLAVTSRCQLPGAVHYVRPLQDGQHVAALCEGSLRLWDMEERREKAAWEVDPTVPGFDVSLKESMAAICVHEGIRLIGLDEEIDELHPTPGRPLSVRSLPEPRSFVAGTETGQVCIIRA